MLKSYPQISLRWKSLHEHSKLFSGLSENVEGF